MPYKHSSFPYSTLFYVCLFLTLFQLTSLPILSVSSQSAGNVVSGSNRSECAGAYCLDDYINSSVVIRCPPSFWCPGNQSAQLCPRGYYCPTPAEIYDCPTGYYCPPASLTPRKCSSLASCPTNSHRYFHWGILLLLCALLILIPILIQLYNNKMKKLQVDNVNQVNEKIAQVVAVEQKKKGSLIITGHAHEQQHDGQRRASLALMAAGVHESNGSNHHGQTLADTAAIPQLPPLHVRLNHVKASVKVNGKDKIIVNDISCVLEPGMLTAVMGPSGAGKSSLINVLTGAVDLVDGTVEATLHGHERIKHLSRSRELNQVGVVPQADIMLNVLTPRDILTHSALARLPKSWSWERKKKRVEAVLELLQLEKVADTPVGDELTRGLSGGEKKRVNIGIEMVCSPSLLILDEPTTGLDSSTAHDLVQLLKDFTMTNVSVVAVLHQPRTEIFSLFDRLLLLAPGGRTVYFGSANKTLHYFASIGYPCPPEVNLADWVIDVIAGKAGAPQLEEIVFKEKEKEERRAGLSFTANNDNNHNNNKKSFEEEKAIVDPVTSSSSSSLSKRHRTPQLRQQHSSATARALGLPEARLGTAQLKYLQNYPFGQNKLPSVNIIQDYIVQCWVETNNSIDGEIYVNHDKTNNNNNNNSIAQSSGPSSTSASASAEKVAISASPNFFMLTLLYLYRGLLVSLRSLSSVSLELCMHGVAGLIVGMAFTNENWFLLPLPFEYHPFCPEPMRKQCHDAAFREFVLLMCTYTVMAVGLVASISGCRSFGAEIENGNLRRELESGAHLTAYFIGKCLSDVVLIVGYSFIYTTSYFLVASPPSTFNDFFGAIFLLELVCFAIGYVSTALLNGENSLLCAAISSLLAGLGTDNDGAQKTFVWARWFAEAIFISEAREDLLPAQLRPVLVAYFDGRAKFKLDMYKNDLLALIIFAVVLRAMAFVLLWRRKKNKFW